MRIALLIFALPLLGQTVVTMEPQPLVITERILGSRQFGLWRVTVQSDQPNVWRGTITAASPISELTADMAQDILARAARGNRLSVLGRGFDMFAPLAAQGLSGYAFAANSGEAQWAAGALTVAGVFRNLFRGSAPDPTRYITKLLPETIPCKEGACGDEWFVVTGLVSNAKPIQFEISPAAARLEKLRLARIAAYGAAWN